jgi:hypothetical protein
MAGSGRSGRAGVVAATLAGADARRAARRPDSASGPAVAIVRSQLGLPPPESG